MENLELQKLDLNKSSSSKKNSKDISMPKRKRKIFKGKNVRVIAAVAAVVLLIAAFLGYKAKVIYADAMRTKAQAQVAVAALKQQDVVVAKEELKKTQTELLTLKKDLDSIGLLGYIPVAGWYIRDAQHGVNAASYGVNAAITTTDSLIPYADVLGLKGGSSFSAGSAQDRIRLAVQTLGKVVPKIDNIEADLVKAQAEIDKVDAGHYPNFWKFKKVRAQVEQIKSLADEGVTAVEQGKPLIKVLPSLLGDSESKKYMVIFQNDKELRPTGGFITFYALFNVDEGDIKVDTSSDIYDLDSSIPSHGQAPAVLRKYLNVSTFNIRDANLSPDFGKSMDTFSSMYKKSSLYEPVDGIIAIDTHFLVHVIDILGEVQAQGLTFTSENDPRCDCPQVVYELENQTSRPVNYVRDNRKALLGELLYATMQKALSSSPKEYWGRLVQAGIKDAQEKHVLFDLYNKDAQKGIEALNWGGLIRQTDGDYLHINDANLGGNKANMYVTQAVRMDYDVKDGKINKTVTITYKNPKPHSDCNLERGGLCLNAPTRTWQRVYVPKGSELTDNKGSEAKVETYDDLDKSVFEGYLRVNPLGKAEISYTYQLPFKADSNELPLLIQKQPGFDVIPYEIYVNGKLKDSFDLRADKQMTVEL